MNILPPKYRRVDFKMVSLSKCARLGASRNFTTAQDLNARQSFRRSLVYLLSVMPKYESGSKKGRWAHGNMSILSFFTRLEASVDKAKEINQHEQPSSSDLSPRSADRVLAPRLPSNEDIMHNRKKEGQKCPNYKWLKGSALIIPVRRLNRHAVHCRCI